MLSLFTHGVGESIGDRSRLLGTDKLEKSKHNTNVHNPVFGQPMCVAIQIALVKQ